MYLVRFENMISYKVIFWFISIRVCTINCAEVGHICTVDLKSNHSTIHHVGPETSNVYGFTVIDIKGQSINMSGYKGKVLLIVNVTFINEEAISNIKILNNIYNKYSKKGLEILGFPSTQRWTMNPDSDETISEAIQNNKVNFQIFTKLNINQDNCESLLWIYLKKKAQEIRCNGRNIPKNTENNEIHNFTQFIVNREGQVIGSYPPKFDNGQYKLSENYIEEYFKKIKEPSTATKTIANILKKISTKKKVHL